MLVGDSSSHSRAGIENVPEIEDEANLEFVTGFPCNHHRCNGDLVESGYAGRTAVVCSVCEDVYYVLADT